MPWCRKQQLCPASLQSHTKRRVSATATRQSPCVYRPTCACRRLSPFQLPDTRATPDPQPRPDRYLHALPQTASQPGLSFPGHSHPCPRAPCTLPTRRPKLHTESELFALLSSLSTSLKGYVSACLVVP